MFSLSPKLMKINMLRRYTIILLTLLIALSLWDCTQNQATEIAGGGGVETTGGQIISLAGKAAGARVRLIPADYNPLLHKSFPDSLSTWTNNEGIFSLRGVAQGKYNLEVWQKQDGSRLLRTGIVLAQGFSKLHFIDTLKMPCQARIVWENPRGGSLFIPGTSTFQKISQLEIDSGKIILDSLPEGYSPPIFLADSKDPSLLIKLTDSLQLRTGMLNEFGAYVDWLHQGVLSINTGSTIGQSSESLGNYPLLLRLNANNFNFQEAKSKGEDIRFFASSGNPLAFEIESWNAITQQAEIWIRLPYLSLSNSLQKITLVWGKTDAKAKGNGRAVFDTTQDFVSVWHLSEAANNSKGGYKDVTVTGMNGWGNMLKPDTTNMGLIAGSQKFSGEGSNIRMDNAPLQGRKSFMVSAWVSRAKSFNDSLSATILSRWEEKDSTGFWLEYSPLINGLRFGLGLQDSQKIFTVDAPNIGFNLGEWHFVAASYDGIYASIFWDGALVGKVSSGGAQLTENVRDFLIGAKGNINSDSAEVNFFSGHIDEVRIYKSMPSATRLNLEFLTQKPNASVISLQKLY